MSEQKTSTTSNFSHVCLEIEFETVEQLQMEILRLRDELIGAAAELGELRARLNAPVLNAVAAQAKTAVDNSQELVRRIDDLERRNQQILASASWRVGNLVIRPFSFVRRMFSRGS